MLFVDVFSRISKNPADSSCQPEHYSHRVMPGLLELMISFLCSKTATIYNGNAKVDNLDPGSANFTQQNASLKAH